MLAENYPQLKSDGPMIEAQRTYSEVEANIAAARRFYNASVAELSNAVQIFPGAADGLCRRQDRAAFFPGRGCRPHRRGRVEISVGSAVGRFS